MNAADVKTAKVKTWQGRELDTVVKVGSLTLDGAMFVKTVIVRSDVVIHVMDCALLPKKER